uniref:Uncharacterized protein n=1 Tax=Pristionchus pacificus TaxID=54126 RepID=A0A2A6BFL4_PRIPA|eukprot:PDM64672.1 hypothetical protein PRIPAC_52928 [Pristionchus pacificus]
MIARTRIEVSRVVSKLDLECDTGQAGHFIVYSVGATKRLMELGASRTDVIDAVIDVPLVVVGAGVVVDVTVEEGGLVLVVDVTVEEGGLRKPTTVKNTM